MILDTSFLVGLFSPDDPHHVKASAILNLSKRKKWILADRVLEETFTVLTYNKGLVFSTAVLNILKNTQGINICSLHPEEIDQVWIQVSETQKKISFTDHVVIYLSKKHNAQPLSFDDQIIKAVKSLN